MTAQVATRSPAASPGLTRRPDLGTLLPYLLVLAVALLVGLLGLRPWQMPPSGAFADTGGDFFWMQAMFQVHGQSGVFGVSTHLAWPDGASPWSYPQLGMLAGLFAWIVVGWFGVAATSAVLYFVAFAAGLNSVAVLFFFRSFIGSRLGWLAAAFSLSLGLSPFVLGRAYHANLVAFFLVPIVLGVVARWGRGSARLGWWWVAAVAAAVAPMWWTVVMVLFVPALGIPGLARRRWSEFVAVMVVWAAVIVGFAVQGLVTLVATRPGETHVRGEWESNQFGGHLSDLLVGSPFLTDRFAVLQEIAVGSSGDLVGLGMIPLLGAWVCFFAVVGLAPRTLASGADVRLLSAAAPLSLLFFVAGGFGNFQAAAAVLAGTSSPARVWSRLLLVVALIGLAWALVLIRDFLDRRRLTPTTVGAIATAAVILVAGALALDLTALTRPMATAAADLPEAASLQYLDTAVDTSCPIAQLPQEGMPSPRVTVAMGDVDAYRGLVPYLLQPERFWSFGSWVAGASGGLNSIATTLDAPELARVADLGFCAVLYDKQLAASAGEAELEGLTVAPEVSPDFDSPRFSVYLLPQ